MKNRQIDIDNLLYKAARELQYQDVLQVVKAHRKRRNAEKFRGAIYCCLAIMLISIYFALPNTKNTSLIAVEDTKGKTYSGRAILLAEGKATGEIYYEINIKS